MPQECPATPHLTVNLNKILIASQIINEKHTTLVQSMSDSQTCIQWCACCGLIKMCQTWSVD